MRVVLASSSPRRLLLLKACGLDVHVHPTDIDETELPSELPEAMVLRLAEGKARAVPDSVTRGAHPPVPVIAADTTVALSNAILAKPVDDGDARRMLRMLSGKVHQVYTGFCVRFGAEERVGVVRTDVTFRTLGHSEIDAYVQTGEPRDKAGAYGIQGAGGAFVDTVHGSYPNIVGLPMAEVIRALTELTA